MANGTIDTILGLPVGGFLRTSAGFFQRMPDGGIAFLPSIFRMPWHSKTPRIVDRPEIERLLRMESIEMAIAILMLLLAVHYYFLDILDFYLAALNLPMAVIAHAVSTVLSVILILYINNAPFSWLRARMTTAMPIAEGAFAAQDFDDWQGPQKLWRLSLVTNENAASLRKGVVMLYLVLMMCSLPLLLAIIVSFVFGNTRGTDNSAFIAGFAFYAALSFWAFFESALVLHKRWQGGRTRRLHRMHQA
jgi:hypothetical protein